VKEIVARGSIHHFKIRCRISCHGFPQSNFGSGELSEHLQFPRSAWWAKRFFSFIASVCRRWSCPSSHTQKSLFLFHSTYLDTNGNYRFHRLCLTNLLSITLSFTSTRSSVPTVLFSDNLGMVATASWSLEKRKREKWYLKNIYLSISIFKYLTPSSISLIVRQSCWRRKLYITSKRLWRIELRPAVMATWPAQSCAHLSTFPPSQPLSSFISIHWPNSSGVEKIQGSEEKNTMSNSGDILQIASFYLEFFLYLPYLFRCIHPLCLNLDKSTAQGALSSSRLAYLIFWAPRNQWQHQLI